MAFFWTFYVRFGSCQFWNAGGHSCYGFFQTFICFIWKPINNYFCPVRYACSAESLLLSPKPVISVVEKNVCICRRAGVLVSDFKQLCWCVLFNQFILLVSSRAAPVLCMLNESFLVLTKHLSETGMTATVPKQDPNP